MKKLFILTFAALAYSASAQYVCMDKGTVFNYHQKAEGADGKEIEFDYTAKIVGVEEVDGTKKVTLETVQPVPGSDFATNTEEHVVIYNPASDMTTYMLGSEESIKNDIIKMITTAAEQAGQSVPEDKLEELRKEIRVKGELALDLDAKAAPGTKLPNKNMRINMGPESFSMNLWEIKLLGNESVTTPAGTFDCLKVSYTHKVSMGQGSEKMYITEWYAPGIGQVRQEVADKKGKVIASDQLISIQKAE